MLVFHFPFLRSTPSSLLSHSPADATQPALPRHVTDPHRCWPYHRVERAQANEQRVCHPPFLWPWSAAVLTTACLKKKKKTRRCSSYYLPTGVIVTCQPLSMTEGTHAIRRSWCSLVYKKINAGDVKIPLSTEHFGHRSIQDPAAELERSESQRACCSGTLLPLGFQANNAEQMQGG